MCMTASLTVPESPAACHQRPHREGRAEPKLRQHPDRKWQHGEIETAVNAILTLEMKSGG
jgi:hypothetical protein